MPAIRYLCAAVTVGSLMLSGTVPVAGQYFGRNKVQYQRFDFQHLETEHFDIYYYPEEAQAAERAAQMAERWHERLSVVLAHELRGRQPLILYASHPHFEQTNAVSGSIGEATGGVTEGLRRRIVLPVAASLEETDHVIGHELLHAFQFDITSRGNPSYGGNVPAALYLPLWFIEGMAEYLSIGPVDPHTAMWMRDAVMSDRLPSLNRLDDAEYFPYRYGQAFWAYVSGRWGDEIPGRVLKAVGPAGNWQGALLQVLRVPLDTLSAEWHGALRQRYAADTLAAFPADHYGRQLMSKARGGGTENLAPALSPDGARLAFLSERGGYSIEMYVADAQTGEVIRRITKTLRDPHFESLQFVASSGTWDPSGREVAFAGIAKGNAVLHIAIVESGDTRKIPLQTLDEIFQPAWSPDGRFIALVGTVGGQSDLYVYDLETQALRQLTEDPYIEWQPAWSPDGTQLVIATDRFTTRLPDLEPGQLRLALVEAITGDVSALPGFDQGKHINAQWLPDGRSLLFLSDESGATNLYRMDLGTSEIEQVTSLTTGISGISATSPALSVAARTGAVAFAAYEAGHHNIYMIDDPETLSPSPVRTIYTERATLPPIDRTGSELVQLLNDPVRGLPDPTTFTSEPYHVSLGLDYIAPPSLVVGADAFGTFIGGGTALFFSDLLGDHNLSTLLQVNGGINDIAAQVTYVNLARRLNWGASVSQIPYVSQGFSRTLETVDGVPAIVDRIYRYRQTNREISAIQSYPLNRSRRVEWSGGLRNITFSRELDTRAYELSTGALLLDEDVNLPAPDALNLGQISLATVFDNSYFGATGPILGSRSRLEVGGVGGSIWFFTGLADYRRYVQPVRPFTLAGRILHYGRYGPDAEDNRITELFLGYPNLVRGYDYGSFDAIECVDGAGSSCPIYDQLFGSRMIVANAELRFPLFGVLGIGSGYYGILPVDFISFFDAGLAWRSDLTGTATDERAFFLGGDRDPVTSTGLGLRLNLMGFFILELDYVHPFDRPQKNWIWQFSINQGF